MEVDNFFICLIYFFIEIVNLNNYERFLMIELNASYGISLNKTGDIVFR